MRSRILPLLIFTLIFSVFSVSAEEEEEEPKEILYNEIKPSLIANLASGGRYIRCDIQLMTHDPEQLENIKLHAPALRHALLLLLSEQDGKSLKIAKGKEKLRKQALTTSNGVLKELTEKEGIENLFFTSFYVQ